MALTNGTHLGPYEILRPIGAGGMGQVYKAHETRLNHADAVREVNMKRIMLIVLLAFACGAYAQERPEPKIAPGPVQRGRAKVSFDREEKCEECSNGHMLHLKVEGRNGGA
jgi:hypothetical protein